MKKLVEVALGIVTSVGGFLEIGSVATAAQAGAQFGYQLLWAVLLGGLCIMFLVEMSGRFAAVSRHTIPDAIRERFGFPFFFVTLVGLTLVTLLVLAAEIGGACIALELATGVALQWWAVPVAALAWLLLWRGRFAQIEHGVSLLGLVTLCFVVAAVVLRPPLADLAAGLVPSLPGHERARYWFIAVSVLGASVSPYLFNFYSAGAIEDDWDESYLATNRAVAGLGMGLGAAISAAVLVVAAIVFAPRGIRAEHYSELGQILVPVFGGWGLWLVIASFLIACIGAALELGLGTAYLFAQGFGWNWGKDLQPSRAARFSLVYTVAMLLGALVILTGIDPLQLTMLSMALTAVILPLATLPFLILMNDERYVRRHRNGRVGNAVVVFVTALGFVLAIVTIPLELLGG